MLVRTISQLPKITRSSDLKDGCLVGVSEPIENDNTFSSKAVRLSTISGKLSTVIDEQMGESYGLKDGGVNLNVKDISTKVNMLSAEDCEISGIKHLNDWPWISADFPEDQIDDKYKDIDYGYIFPNIKKVNQLIDSQPVYFSSDDSYVAEGNPLPAQGNSAIDSSVPVSLSYAQTIGSKKFYFWRIDEKDSSKAIYDAKSQTVDGYEMMRDTGQLVVWGWLADKGDVPPEMAWVGLFAAVKCEDSNDTQTIEVPISIQPWIRGEYASTLQYVSFNVPVKAGLKVKIKTGFTVNNQNSGFQNSGTLTFIDMNIPNSFFGYIVK